MKYAIIGIVVAVLGFGEYVYVNVMPFPPERRLQKLESIPVAKNVVHQWKMHKINEWVEAENPHAYGALLEEGKRRDDKELIEKAVKLLRGSDTYTARLHLYVHETFTYSNGSSSMKGGFTPEFLALMIMTLEEDLPIPIISQDQQRERSAVAKKDVKSFHEQVDMGNPKYVEAAEILDTYHRS